MSSKREFGFSPRLTILLVLGATTLLVVHGILTRRAFDESVAAERLVADSTPGVMLLAQLRSGLRQVREEALALAHSQAGSERLSEAFDRGVRERLAAYRQASLQPDNELQRRLSASIESLRIVVSQPKPRPDAITRAADATDELAERIVETNARNANSAARTVTTKHRQAADFSVALLGAFVAVILAMGFVVDRRVSRAEQARAETLRELDMFAARVAHDLATPLTPISIALALMRRDLGTTPANLRQIERAEASIKRATELMDSLLAFARAGGKVDPAARSLADAVVREVGATIGSLAEENFASVELDLEPGIEVAASAAILEAMVANLARNAVVYLGHATDRKVTVRARSVGKNAVIEVQDRGPGIPPDVLVRLFRPFERGSTRPGSGLGLATVKRLAEAHGGFVTVTSIVGAGSGSTFTLVIPLAQQAAPTRSRPAVARPA